MLFFEISILFSSDVFVSKNRPKGHEIRLFLVMKSHGSMNPVLPTSAPRMCENDVTC